MATNGHAIGADAEAHEIDIGLGCAIVIHPPAVEAQRVQNGSRHPSGQAYLVRNKDIVRETALLIAAPARDDRANYRVRERLQYPDLRPGIARELRKAILEREIAELEQVQIRSRLAVRFKGYSSRTLSPG